MTSSYLSSAAAATELEPKSVIRGFFLLATAIVLLVYALPSFRTRFLSYGSRSVNATDKSPELSNNTEGRPTSHTVILRLLDFVATLTVPHGFFAHFYVLSAACSAFWAHQYLTHGAALTQMLQHASVTMTSSMSSSQILLLWLLMSAQGLRRLYESIAFSTNSNSRMWFGHYALGLAFYALMSVAVWIEGAPVLRHTFGLTVSTRGIWKLLRISNIAALILFVQASAGQHQAHKHLYELRTRLREKTGALPYSLPTHPLFRTTLTPHYACECLIYFSLCILGAPEGWFINVTLLCALAFVVVNLGVTADGTRAWYSQRFGEDAVKGKARMIPKLW